jgi:hypothetical protein
VQGTAQLTVRTFSNGTNTAVIDMQNTHPVSGNSNPDVVLEARTFSDNTAPTVPVDNGYSANDIDYKSITGLNLKGVGTAGNYSATAATQDITVSTFNIQAKNMTLIASSGAINVNAQIDKSKINGGANGGSLNLLAAGDININANSSVEGISVGRKIGTKTDAANLGDPLVEYFNHDLRLVAGNNITVNGGIWMTGNLSLRADASAAEFASLAGALNFKGAGDGKGGVSIVNPSSLYPLEIRALNIIVGEKSGTTGYSAEFLNIEAGKGASIGSNLRVDTVLRAGVPTKETALETSSTFDGGRLEIILSGGLSMTGGNIAAASTGAGQVISSSAFAAIRGKDVYICHPAGCDIAPTTYNPLNTIRLQGGNSAATNQAGGGAVASADTFILASNFKQITIDGDLILIGGTAARLGSAQPSAGALIDPVLDLVIRTGGSVVLQSGIGTGGTTSTGARIQNFGNIEMWINGGSPGNPAYYTYNDAILGPQRYGPGLIMIGGAGSGIFDSVNRSLDGTGVPITFIFQQGGVVPVQPNIPGGSTGAFGPAVVQTGVNSFDENLLRYIIFSQLDAAKADRIRRGLSDDDVGGAACQ